jgi:hypothetical protein
MNALKTFIFKVILMFFFGKWILQVSFSSQKLALTKQRFNNIQLPEEATAVRQYYS